MNNVIQHESVVLCISTQSLEGLLEGMNPPPSDPDLFVSFRDCHLLILKMIQVYPSFNGGRDVFSLYCVLVLGNQWTRW